MTPETETFLITYNGQTYYSTGKTGTRIKTGTPVREMEADDASRVWVDAANTVYAE